MIVTLTPNPCIDRTVRVGHLARGELNRTSSARSEAAGKGLNVSRALHLHGFETTAVMPVASESATAYLGLVEDGTPISAVPVRGNVRTNLTVLEADGTVTKLNEPGPELDERDIDALIATVDALPATWIAGCGSLPPGAPDDLYARLARLASPDRHVAVDTSGGPLAACVSARPDLIKPNVGELDELVNARVETLGEVVDAAREVVARGARAVLVSLGADGVVFVDRTRTRHAEAAVANVANTVGAGDALLAGYLAAGGGPDAIATAVAWSVAAIRSPGTGIGLVGDADRRAVRVHERVETGRRLRRHRAPVPI
jgi:1-phosphofructokinase